jgi:hypothetical protein
MKFDSELWSEYFPDVPLTESRWFKDREPTLLTEALRIAAEEDKAGRFRIRTQEHIGRYVNATYSHLQQNAEAVGIQLEVTVTMKFDRYRITEQDKDRFRRKLVKAKDCLLFSSAEAGGYGRFHCNRKLVGAHVFSFFAHNVGYLPATGELDQIQVAHTSECLSRSCCNHQHLRLTTKLVNLSERVLGVMREGQLSKAAELAQALVEGS